MFRKLRRLWAQRSIRKFLSEYLPAIELGELKEFKCLDFKFGEYSVKTTKGEYKLHFWELLDSAKEFHIDFCEYQNREWERITCSISGIVNFIIVPKELVIDRESKRQVVNLRNGRARVYPIGNKDNEVDYEHIEYKRFIMKSNFVCIPRVIDNTNLYIYGYL